ncbi:glycerol-3-phosphate dehydrogenase subunit A [Desulfosarcina alkanivorans]|uniref:Glycerol-3-phosphate dehydrogenase n=1 Tax=Desulfosarcina alkanivorans TaxID=571177 RepID=A0A5K7YQT7_9BACT|nr:anaerobic glycerol-3-phosphate dehydrogenase subunit GlpA [Desulfosarcina alkanivorans]BBO70259.1 glycerol-3-phosphate dehydrogenase subunit A [Desulfosarcina alkanivorans]
MNNIVSTQVLIIGGGATGSGLARDLALRGVRCILVEKRDINAGASGGNHGLLHSGARYIASDPAAARECRDEGELIKRLAPQCVEDTGGLFVAVKGDDERYIADFADRCRRCDIDAIPVDPKEALEMEPSLSADTIAAFAVKDASIDPFKLSLDNLAQAGALGTRQLLHHEVVGFDRRGGRIETVRLRDQRRGVEVRVQAEQIVNASGAWAGSVAALAGARINMVYSQGSLIISQMRLGERVINRLRKAADADILVPAGTVSIFGTTSKRIDAPDDCRPTTAEIDAMIDDGMALIPSLAETRYIRAYAGVRPLVRAGGGSDDRAVSRGYSLLDHDADGLSNFTTITGGKLTTYRLMAEKTADLVCRRLGNTSPCRTAVDALPASSEAQYTEPGLTPKMWFKKKDASDLLLCECEMVPTSVFNEIVASLSTNGHRPGLREMGQRSRVGKGPCQGSFCSLRMAAHMYNEGMLSGSEGIGELKDFLNERWRGMQPLLWGPAVSQAELQEALHCGLLGLDVSETA